MANMSKETKVYSRFLLLRIYPESPVHTSANMYSDLSSYTVNVPDPGKCIYTVIETVGGYLGNYLYTFFCVLMFIQIDPNLHIASKRFKLIQTNIYKVLQFIRVNLPSVKGALIGGPTYLLII